MREMGIKAVVPKRCLSKPGKKHKKYPYLLRNLNTTHPNHVWASDITNVNLPGGIVYVVAIIDLHSRKILSWNVSNTMDTSFVMEALMQAMMRYGLPEIFNRFWKTLKYEDLYLYRYDILRKLRKGLSKYFRFYNSIRPHQSLNGNSPDETCSGKSNLKAA